MANLSDTIVETTKEVASEDKTLMELYLSSDLTLPFKDRRISDRRASGGMGGRRASDRGIPDRRKIRTCDMKKITVLIPCYNEEKGIGKVIDDVPKEKLAHLGYHTEIIVINNNSKDRTSKIAHEKGIRVISEKKQGKGNAIKTGFNSIGNDTDYVVMIDGDNTYKAKEIPRLIELLEDNFCDAVIGSRLEGKLKEASLSFSHRLANWFFTFLVRRFYFVNVTDTCTGYFAWKKKVVDELKFYLKSEGFAIETEMITKMAKLGYQVFSVPITYDKREGSSKLSPYIDGIKIVWMLIKNMSWNPKKRAIQNYSRQYDKYLDASKQADAKV